VLQPRILWLLAAIPAAANSFDSVRDLIRREMVAQSIPSIAVAVARDGKIVWEEAFGWADRESRVAATEHTMYSLASISKPITATGLMVLKERGRVDLDKPVNDYLGGAGVTGRAGDARLATVRHVANHTSGLPLHYQFFYEDEPERPPPMDETIRRYGNLVTAPGERYQYSNLGYGILDYVIARVSGESYEDFMRREVFLPLGLTRMSVGIAPRQEKNHAIRYGTDGLPIPYYDFDHRGGSAVYASAHDLVRFGLFHLKANLADQKPILSDSAIDEMQRPTSEPGARTGYGIGWNVTEARGVRIVSHTGGMGGVTTVLSLVPQHKLAVVVLANANTSVVGQVQRAIFGVVLPGGAPLPAAAKAAEKQALPSGEWSGVLATYREDLPFAMRFQPSGDVQVRLGAQLWTLLSDARVENGYLTGRFLGDLGTADANRRPYWLQVSLKVRGDVLNGAVTAQSRPGRRVGNALTHWAELKRR
jgi:CubicO group peptidase (beta-lactamase class C family)